MAVRAIGSSATPSPVAIGGVGGSGTRVAAALLRAFGYELGEDLNDALDNLWFTLLFKRRSVLLDDDGTFASLAGAFFDRMAGVTVRSADVAAMMARLCADRPQHSHDWLVERAASFQATPAAAAAAGRRWGWKEPNTHVVIERLFALRDDLRYIHVVRHPLEMASSRNKQQLVLWGPILLEREVSPSAADALAYWCAVHRRTAAIAERRPERVLQIDFDAVCAAPQGHARMVSDFLGVPGGGKLAAEWCAQVRRPPAHAPPPSELVAAAEDDIRYAALAGYDLSRSAPHG